jgi:hypothetical protein
MNWSHFIVLLKSDLVVQQISFRGWFVEHLSATQVAQQSVTKTISVTIMNLVTPKAGAKHELLFNKPALASRAPEHQ